MLRGRLVVDLISDCIKRAAIRGSDPHLNTHIGWRAQVGPLVPVKCGHILAAHLEHRAPHRLPWRRDDVSDAALALA
jgi:hypothetical protein